MHLKKILTLSKLHHCECWNKELQTSDASMQIMSHLMSRQNANSSVHSLDIDLTLSSISLFPIAYVPLFPYFW